MQLVRWRTGLFAGAAFALSLSGVLAAAALPGAAQTSVDWGVVEQALGKSGQVMPGDVFRVGMPRSDLQVSVEGVPVQPGFALGSYAAFRQMDNGQTMVMGDLVLTDEEIPGVMSGLFGSGFQVTAVHNHLNQVVPHVMYMHYLGMGDAVQLASGLHQALSTSGTPLGPSPAAGSPATPLDTGMLASILGRSGQVMAGGVFQVNAPPTTPVMMMGIAIPGAMGVTTSMSFQPTEGGNAAITGDFVLTADEVNPVASALRSNGIEVTAIHNHGLDDQPRIFYMHFWANDDPAKLARGLRAALDRNTTVAGVQVGGAPAQLPSR
jgi:uncharacterized protein DUF1259